MFLLYLGVCYADHCFGRKSLISSRTLSIIAAFSDMLSLHPPNIVSRIVFVQPINFKRISFADVFSAV